MVQVVQVEVCSQGHTHEHTQTDPSATRPLAGLTWVVRGCVTGRHLSRAGPAVASGGLLLPRSKSIGASTCAHLQGPPSARMGGRKPVRSVASEGPLGGHRWLHILPPSPACRLLQLQGTWEDWDKAHTGTVNRATGRKRENRKGPAPGLGQSLWDRRGPGRAEAQHRAVWRPKVSTNLLPPKAAERLNSPKIQSLENLKEC